MLILLETLFQRHTMLIVLMIHRSHIRVLQRKIPLEPIIYINIYILIFNINIISIYIKRKTFTVIFSLMSYQELN